MISDAVIDDTGQYRYLLCRDWGLFGQSNLQIAWIMLNPSTADAYQDDPTIRRCKAFSELWGYGRLVVVNLYALRSTDPKKLFSHSDPVGPRNEEYIKRVVQESQLVVAAWGAFKLGVPDAIRRVLSDKVLWCLGTTKQGHPRHPLYVKSSTEKEIYTL